MRLTKTPLAPERKPTGDLWMWEVMDFEIPTKAACADLQHTEDGGRYPSNHVSRTGPSGPLDCDR